MWSKELLCKKCAKILYIDEYEESFDCENCQQHYATIEDEVFHATANSGTSIFYMYTPNGDIKRCHFHNQPTELLDEARQKANFGRWGQDPNVLAPIVRDYYDAAKKRLQSFLTLDYIPLTTIQKDQIATDMPMQSALNLVQMLKTICPTQISKIDVFLMKYESMLKRMKWVRDKSEHHLMRLWAMPGRIYEDRHEQPNSINPPVDMLNRNFIEKTHAAVIDIFYLILEIDLRPRGQDQFDILREYKIY